MKQTEFILVPLLFFLLMLSVACSPKFYLIDRQTVLEDEAAGEWPDFERDFIEKSKAQGPTPFTQTQNGAKKEKLYNVLNGELMGQSEEESHRN